MPDCYYRILVPTIHRATGKPISTRFHRVWDEKVRAIAGGLTIHQPVKGQWVFENTLTSERMIPVEIACSVNRIEEILRMTRRYYDQIEIFCVKMSEEVIRYRG